MAKGRNEFPLPGKPQRESIRDRTIANRFRDQSRDDRVRIANLERRKQGSLGFAAGLDLAVTDPGSLLFRYKFSEDGPSPESPQDTAGHPSGPYHLTYNANTGGVDPISSESWDSAHDVTYKVIDRTGEDGSMQFNYNEMHEPPGNESTWSDPYLMPGAWFSNNSTPAWDGTTDSLRTVCFFFKPAVLGGTVRMGMVGRSSFSDVNDGLNGWGFVLEKNGGVAFYASDGPDSLRGTGMTGGPNFDPTTEGLHAPGVLTEIDWYHAAVTCDRGDTNTWKFYLNAELVDQGVFAHTPSIYTGTGVGIRIGELILYGSFVTADQSAAFFYGDIDEVDGYSIPLTQAQLAAIVAAGGDTSNPTRVVTYHNGS